MSSYFSPKGGSAVYTVAHVPKEKERPTRVFFVSIPLAPLDSPILPSPLPRLRGMPPLPRPNSGGHRA